MFVFCRKLFFGVFLKIEIYYIFDKGSLWGKYEYEGS